MTAEVGTDTAQPTLHDVMMLVPAEAYGDPETLHAAVLAARDRLDHLSKLATQWAESIRAREVERLGSQRKAASVLGVSRGAVRPKRAQ